MPKMSKGDQVELIERVKSLIIRANKDSVIVDWIVKEKGLKKQMAQDYVARGHQSLNEDLLPERHNEKIEAIARLKLAIADCITNKNWRYMLAAQAQLTAMIGLDEPIKQELNHSGAIGFTFEETKTYELPPNHDLTE